MRSRTQGRRLSWAPGRRRILERIIEPSPAGGRDGVMTAASFNSQAGPSRLTARTPSRPKSPD